MQPKHWHRGFSLVELMVTLSLLAFFGLVATQSSFDTRSWFASHRLRAAARELSMNMQKTRTLAIKENRSWAIVFDTGSNSYSICSNWGPDNQWSTLADNTITKVVDFNSYRSGVGYGHGSAAFAATQDHGSFPADDVSFTGNLVVFNSSGLPSTSGYCYLSNSQSGAYAVGAQNSGTIRVKSWKGSDWN
jgi:prepilin-type N-terminal cleavage/methylation domain-containing protein